MSVPGWTGGAMIITGWWAGHYVGPWQISWIFVIKQSPPVDWTSHLILIFLSCIISHKERKENTRFYSESRPKLEKHPVEFVIFSIMKTDWSQHWGGVWWEWSACLGWKLPARIDWGIWRFCLIRNKRPHRHRPPSASHLRSLYNTNSQRHN